MSDDEAFVTLGLPTSARMPEIRAAYREQARATHPDLGGSAEAFARIRAAFEQLCESEPARKVKRERCPECRGKRTVIVTEGWQGLEIQCATCCGTGQILEAV
jgi:DnaJ-class molecular chaperone